MIYITHEWAVNYTWNLPFEWLQLPNLEFCPSPLKYGHIYQLKAPSDEFWASHGIQRIEHFLLDENLGTYKDENLKFREFIWFALGIFYDLRLILNYIWFYLTGPVSFSDDDSLLNVSKSQKLTVLSCDAEANKNSWGWNSTSWTGPPWSINSFIILPALKSQTFT